MSEIALQVGKGPSLMDYATAEKLVAGLAYFSYTGTIQLVEDVCGPNNYAVTVTAQQGRDQEMLIAVLNSLELNWQVVAVFVHEILGSNIPSYACA
jgi:hypothetical protein